MNNHDNSYTENRLPGSLSSIICCVPECPTTGYKEIDKHGKPSYHRFPEQGDPLREEWLRRIRIGDEQFKIKSHSVVCSLHFHASSMEKSRFSQHRHLKPAAVPSIFNCWRTLPQPSSGNDGAETEIRPQKRKKRNSTEENSNNIATDMQDDTHTPLVNDINVLKDQAALLKGKILALEEENAILKRECEQAKEEKIASQFCVDNLKPTEFPFYTGFPSRDSFYAALEIIKPGKHGENVKLVLIEEEIDGAQEQELRKLSPDDQFFLFLCRTRPGLLEIDLAHRFKISVASVNGIIISWANFLYLRLSSMNVWLSREMVDKNMPDWFREKYPGARVIIDCSEITVEMPPSLLMKNHSYGSCKNTNALKSLIGIAPCGSVTFVSQLYYWDISFREITMRSGFLDLEFDTGDRILSYKDFYIQDLLDKKGVKIIAPPFQDQLQQMPENNLDKTQDIAAEKMHFEKAFNKIKDFHIFDQVIPATLAGSVNQIWAVCALLTLFQQSSMSCPDFVKVHGL